MLKDIEKFIEEVEAGLHDDIIDEFIKKCNKEDKTLQFIGHPVFINSIEGLSGNKYINIMSQHGKANKLLCLEGEI